MYKHTFQLNVEYLSPDEDQDTTRARVQRLLTQDVKWIVDGGGSKLLSCTLGPIATVDYYDPKARITNDRLRHYHAAMRGRGYTTHEARTDLRRALGITCVLASSMTNAQLDKLLAFIGAD